MKQKLSRCLAGLLALCLLVAMVAPAFATDNGTATLSSTSMTLDGSIDVNFSGTASSTEYYEIQVKSSDYSTTYLDEWVDSGSTYTINADGADNLVEITTAGTYYIYVGYWKDSSWASTAYEGTITVTESGSSGDSGDSGSTSTNGTAELSAYTMTESGSITVSFSGTASNSEYYKIEIADSSWSTKYVDTSITSGDSYTIEGYSAGTYQIYVGYWTEDDGWVQDALPTTSFTVTEDSSTSTNGTASLSATTMTESGSIEVTFSGTATDSEYYEIQVKSSDYSTTYLDEWVNSGNSYTISSLAAGTYYIYVGYWADSEWKSTAYEGTFTVTEDGAATNTYAVTITPSGTTTCEQNESITFTAVVTKNGEEITLSEQSNVKLWIWADIWASDHSEGLTDCTISPNTGLSNTVTVSFPSVGTYYIAYTLQDSSYTDILKNTDVATITVTESTATASEELTTGSLSCDFMRGMDLSTFYTNWTNGAVYYDYEGTEYSAAKGNAVDFFKFLYDKCGVNWVRLRVWNAPYDEDGNPYGGGNNDVETAATIGKWASDAGMTVLIDFHYSDFWADPGRQLAPKAWADMDIDEKVEALYDYTYESLEYLLDAGVNVGMVQVGNETNGALCGEAIDWSVSFDASTNQTWKNICALFSSGSQAVRDISDKYGTTIKVALHFTNPNNANPSWYAGLLDDAGVDYDAMGISYYMYWHGTLTNLQSEIETIASTYGKEVFIAETAYPYTDENFDSLANSVSTYDDFDMNSNLYAISEAGQEAALTAILNTAANSNGCTGMFYWEPAWTALDSSTLDNGTGWSTKYANDYLTDYDITASEGSSFDNQTLFDSTGHPLAALRYYADYLNGSQVEHTAAEAVIENEVAATCTENGSYDNVVYCSVCGEELSRETVTVAATGHTYDYDNPSYTWSDDYSTCTVTFTCSAGDETTTYECTVTSSGTAATCTAKGSMTYVAVCTVNGLTYANIKTVETDMIAHTWDDSVVTKEATADEAGEMTYTCTVCGETYTESIAALGNDADDEEDADGTSDSSKASSSSSSSSSESKTSSAKTGDNASLTLWVVLAGIALVVLGALLLMKRRSDSRK